MLSTHYVRPPAGKIFEHELEIKRSKFLCAITRAEDESAAREFLASRRALYPDARHHCSAFIFHVDDANPVERSSDDGEPSGTAGKPMLDVLRGSGMLDIIAVTTRYFGGIKLGAGGLVHAYSDSVAETLPLITPVTRSRKELYAVELNHCDAGRIESELRRRQYTVVDVLYGANVTYTLAITPSTKDELSATLASLTSGTAAIHNVGFDWIEQ